MASRTKTISTKSSRRTDRRPGSHVGYYTTRDALAVSLKGLGIVVLLVFVAFVIPAGASASLMQEPPRFAGSPQPTDVARTSVKDFHAEFYPAGEFGSEGGEVHWRIEEASSPGGPWALVPGGAGTITATEVEKLIEIRSRYGQTDNESVVVETGELTGLQPEKTYYVRAIASSEAGEVEANSSFETSSLGPTANINVRNVTGTSAYLAGDVNTRGFATRWRYEYATSEAGEFHVVPGGEGAISRTEAEADRQVETVPDQGPNPPVGFRFTGLKPATNYYVRLFSENEQESGGHKTMTTNVQSFETSGPPTATTFAVHALHGESLRLLGSVSSGSVLADEEQTVTLGGVPSGGTFALSFDGHSTGATGSGDLAGGAAGGTGDLSACNGWGQFTPGSAIVTNAVSFKGAFIVGQSIFNSEVANGTTITAVGANTLTLSKPAIAGAAIPFISGSKTISNVVTSSGAFAVGQGISGNGIYPNTVITAVEPGTLTLSLPVSVQSSGVALTTNTKIVSNLAVSEGAFTVGEAISGPGIPAGTTIVDQNANEHRLTLSANTTEDKVGASLTANIPYNADGTAVQRALEELPSKLKVDVEGLAGGAYTIIFDGEGIGVNEPQLGADGSGLIPTRTSTVTVATTDEGGEASYDLHNYFEYVSSRQFVEDGWAKAVSTPVVAGSGQVGQDVPAMQAGETYYYRLAATSTFPGNALIRGAEATLTVPTPAAVEESVCPNEQLRSGSSVNLPACRAYEQVTPVDKEGSQEVFLYSTTGFAANTIAGEDGEHFAVENKGVNWGSSSTQGQSPYFFSRDPRKGWQMTAASAQPETGVKELVQPIFSDDLTNFGFQERTDTSANAEAEEIALRAGPPGGPYVTVASFPHKTTEEVFVGASRDFSKLFFQSEDRSLLGSPTGTKSGQDLYEYSSGQLRQVNVNSEGKKLGSCGAAVARGGDGESGRSDRHAVSSDGSRIYFEAVPGANCSEAAHLYLREGAAKTVDIGTYSFLAANPDGSEVLLERRGATTEVFLYEAASATVKPLFATETTTFAVSEDLSAIYFFSNEARPETEAPALSREGEGEVNNLYRYDVGVGKLSFVVQAEETDSNTYEAQVSPDGRYVYFGSGRIGGVPGGALAENGGFRKAKPTPFRHTTQIYRFDSEQDSIECISCASPFDPEPKLASLFTGRQGSRANGTPIRRFVTADGSRAFFETPAALVPGDVDGEVTPAEVEGYEYSTQAFDSPSTDVYEWRRQGLDGCAHLQGCLALITSGRGGYLNILLGTAQEGHDVFFYTGSQLVAQDNDTAGDIYDARIDGGFAPPPSPPVECEGDACSTPANAPNDATPSSLTFDGAGNLVAPPTPAVKSKATKKVVKCAKGKTRSRGKCVKQKRKRKSKKRARPTSHKGGK